MRFLRIKQWKKNGLRHFRGSRGWDIWFGVSLLASDPLRLVAIVTLSNLLNCFESHYSSVTMVYQSVFSRETEPVGYIYFKESVHLTVGAGTSEICRTGWRFRREMMLQSWGGIFSSLEKVSFASKAFQLIGWGANLLYLNWLLMLATSTKYLYSNT